MKYLLDTSVLVEALRPRPSKAVRDWISDHSFDGFGAAAPVMAELHAGLAVLAPGAQRNAITAWLLKLQDFFKESVFPFDESAARPCARLMAQACVARQPAPLAEAMMAGVAESNGLILAAASTPLLRFWGGPLVDPWRS